MKNRERATKNYEEVEDKNKKNSRNEMLGQPTNVEDQDTECSTFVCEFCDYKAGKKKAFGFLVGQVMKRTKGKATPKIVNDLLNKHLN